MTYYGRWTYKFEEGARGARPACSSSTRPDPAGYPFSVVQGNLRERFDLVAPDKNMGRASIEGWLPLDAAKSSSPRPVRISTRSRNRRSLAISVRCRSGCGHRWRIRNSMRTIQSKNVVARLEGSDAQLRDEYIVYTAHWDHLGKGAR